MVDLWGFALHSAPTKRELIEDDRQEREIARAEADGNQDADILQKILAGEKGAEKSKSIVIEGEKKEQSGEEKETLDDKGQQEMRAEALPEEQTSTPGVSEESYPKEESSSAVLVEKEDTKEDVPPSIDSGKTQPASKGWSSYIPSIARGKNPVDEKTDTDHADSMTSSKSWGSYIPSIRGTKTESGAADDQDSERSWASFLPSGQGFSSYIPKSAISSIAAMHKRDPSKSVAEQLYDFSKTPVGAAGISVASGSSYASSIYAAYSAYSSVSGVGSQSNLSSHGMEFLSMPHTRSSTKHLCPRVGDLLVTNLRAPLLTLVEDTSPGVHDTLMAACDPHRYEELGVEHYEEHGSCAENLVLALQELNMQVGLKGSRAIGADVTVNNVPAPLNLFMNIPWTKDGSLAFDPPKGKRGDYVKFRAERDVVIVVSACPQDITEINGKRPMVAHFVVESPSQGDDQVTQENEAAAQSVIEKSQPRTKLQSRSQSGTSSASRKSAPKLQIRSSSQRQLGPQAKLSSEQSHTNVLPSSQRRISGIRRPSTLHQQQQTSIMPLKETQRVEKSPKEGRSKPRKLERRGTTS